MSKKTIAVAASIAALAVALAATASSLVWVCRKVRAFESQHGGSVYRNLSKDQLDELVKAEIAAVAGSGKRETGDGCRVSDDGARVSGDGSSEPKTEVQKPKPAPIKPLPYVRFASGGRYLPPGGARAIAIEAMNVTNVHAQICRVEPRNVVQLLAREEQEYRRYSWDSSADGEETEELSGEVEEHKIPCVNRPDEKETVAFGVKVDDGGSANGIYLVAVRNADMPRADGWWINKEKRNPNRYRLVCLSDLGLSVRMNGTDSPGVWVTSLMKGVPVDGAQVTVYSKSNVKVLEGMTDENGWCRPQRVAKGEPFAVVVESAAGDDSTFLALRGSMEVDETDEDGGRRAFLKPEEVESHVWTDRGIYRHGEKIMFHALVRNGLRRAPSPMPLELRLISPKGDVFSSATRTTDAEGAAIHADFSVPAEQPSGMWTVQAKIPGKEGRVIGSRTVKIEEFAPPQIRVRVAADESAHPSNFAFTVSAEHLFGGAAHALACEGAVVFDDVPFAPPGWKDWSFGNDDLALKPCFRRLDKSSLDRAGEHRFAAPLWADAGLPRAAVRATAQGTVFEDGGRPATARATCVLHYYPFYVGCDVPAWSRIEHGVRPRFRIVCVGHDGRRIADPRSLKATLERIDTVYSYRTQPNGWETWDSTRVRKTIAHDIPVEVPSEGDATLELPVDECGDYALTVVDPASGSSFAKTFYLSDWGDRTVRAPLSDPTAVALTPDKPFYRVGETPRIRVRSPFAGAALVSVLRDKDAYTDILALTNATCEIRLRPVTAENAPNLDVFVSVVQSVEANAKHLAARAHGRTTVCVRPSEEEVQVKVSEATVTFPASGGATACVAIEAPGASAALVTVVDEGINILTDEPVPDPVAYFAAPRDAPHPLYDLYHRVLPVLGEDMLRASGVKTGGGEGAEMLGRVSPVPTRRFKPLALWSGRLAVGADGRAEHTFSLGEFVGEVRVTAVAWSEAASGAASVQAKVTPKIVAMPDAPRFAAPGDEFEATLPIYNRAESKGGVGNGRVDNSRVEHVERVEGDEVERDEIEYSIAAGGKAVVAGKVVLERGANTNVVARVKAPAGPGEMELLYRVRGMGETHVETIHLPVRPAVAWVETAGVERRPSSVEGRTPAVGRRPSNVPSSNPNGNPFEKYWEKEYDSPLGEYESALRWLADYPHGCLEQTSSRMFPLISAGGSLASVSPVGADVVRAGVRRVESMVRSNDFVMWPDCNYAPWDREVSLYAAHFLVEAERCGYPLNHSAKDRVMGFLGKWAMSTNDAVSAYACHTLALAGRPEKDRMLRLYDASTNLTLLSRSRLARAFAATHDRQRAEALLASAVAPSSVKEASFAVLALLECDPDDRRILPLVEYLNSRRDRARLCWGTTGENAHALLAVGEYFRHHPAKAGEKFVSWRRLTLPKAEEVRDESSGIAIGRRYLTPEGGEADLANLSRGELVIAELSLRVSDTRELSDLVVEDLFPACFEYASSEIAQTGDRAWVMRSDARDDRMLVFSTKFTLAKGETATFRYPLRVVSAGDYVLPGPSVEAMYHPDLHARRAPSRVKVRH